MTHQAEVACNVDEEEEDDDDQIARAVAQSFDELEASNSCQSHMVSVAFEESEEFKAFLIVNVKGAAPNGKDIFVQNRYRKQQRFHSSCICGGDGDRGNRRPAV